jgi:hypothetical protein
MPAPPPPQQQPQQQQPQQQQPQQQQPQQQQPQQQQPLTSDQSGDRIKGIFIIDTGPNINFRPTVSGKIIVDVKSSVPGVSVRPPADFTINIQPANKGWANPSSFLGSSLGQEITFERGAVYYLLLENSQYQIEYLLDFIHTQNMRCPFNTMEFYKERSEFLSYLVSNIDKVGRNWDGFVCYITIVYNPAKVPQQPQQQPLTPTVTNNDKPPTTGRITIVTNVINDNGGSKQPSDFTITVTRNTLSSNLLTGTTSPGTTISTGPGPYRITENNPDPGYSVTYSSECFGSIAVGETRTCTVTNNDRVITTFGTNHQ